MKIVALDHGDQWTGIAISDALGLLARPLQTVATRDLMHAISQLIDKETISTFVIGLPKTMRGTESEQTKKVRTLLEQLKNHFASYEWVLWDERLTSKQAEKIKPRKSKENKHEAHAVAAALILQSYLEYLQQEKNSA